MQLIHTVDPEQPNQSFPLVKVGDTILSQDDIAAELQYHPAEDMEDAWHQAARSLVIRELLLQQAEALSIDPDLAEQDRIAEVIEQAVTVPEPDEASCQRFFDANPNRFNSPTLLAVSHILLAAAPDDVVARTEQEDTGRELLAQLAQHPADFGLMAREYSSCESRKQAGNLGQISRGQTVEEFENVVWRLPEGIHNQLVESRFGWHIVRVDRRMEGVPRSFNEVKPQIRHYLLERVTRRGLRQYLQVLAAETGIEGVDLEIPDSPLMQ